MLWRAAFGVLLGVACTARPAAAGGAAPLPERANGQGGADSTLEIAPQPGLKPAGSAAGADSAGHELNGGHAGAGVDWNSNPGGETPESDPRPYLGIAVGYPDPRHPGTEGRGLEIVSVDPGSPAERAGLEGRVGMTVVGATGATAGAVLGPLNSLTMPLLQKVGALGHAGDRIVAVDDRRVRTREELEDALSAARPGQTVYLTVIRSLAGGRRKMLKAVVKLGSAGQYATATPGSGRPPH